MSAPGPDGASPAWDQPRVGVVLVAYNEPTVLLRCVAALEASRGVGLEIIVADNSLDERVADALAGRRGLHLLPMGGNRGFCRATNAGIRESARLGMPYTLVLNHDTEVEPGCIAALAARCAALGNRAIVGGKILYSGAPARIWFAGGRLVKWMGVGVHDRFKLVDDGRPESSRDVTYLTGCCLLASTAAFADIGMLREDMFMYLDDAEFSLRARATGYCLHYEPAAVLRHDVGTGTGKSFLGLPDYYLYFSVRNKPLVAGGGAYRAYLHLFALALGAAKATLYGMSAGVPDRGRKVRALLWGMWDSLSATERYQARFPRLFRSREAGIGPAEN
ncbi:MAG TPA: glycosyltransferase family 2 protein [Fibrobacteria bacterium]|nr:glycosyltransferase family 2 protein [Fibrobacteria bacterium]